MKCLYGFFRVLRCFDVFKKFREISTSQACHSDGGGGGDGDDDDDDHDDNKYFYSVFFVVVVVVHTNQILFFFSFFSSRVYALSMWVDVKCELMPMTAIDFVWRSVQWIKKIRIDFAIVIFLSPLPRRLPLLRVYIIYYQFGWCTIYTHVGIPPWSMRISMCERWAYSRTASHAVTFIAARKWFDRGKNARTDSCAGSSKYQFTFKTREKSRTQDETNEREEKSVFGDCNGRRQRRRRRRRYLKHIGNDVCLFDFGICIHSFAFNRNPFTLADSLARSLTPPTPSANLQFLMHRTGASGSPIHQIDWIYTEFPILHGYEALCNRASTIY